MSADDSIVLQSHSYQWPKLAEAEIETIRSSVPKLNASRIEHVGSTSVPGLLAKPIIDIVIEVVEIGDGAIAIEPLESLGYSYWSANPDPKHMFFVKGLPPQGSGRTHHVHIFETSRFDEHLQFRNALLKNPQLVEAYQRLKIELAEKFKYDRDAYTKSKSSFIQAVLKAAE